SKNQWLPFRHTPIWIAFGKPISASLELQKSQARKRIESELAAAFKNLYSELRQKFRLTTDDLPRSPQERMHPRRQAERSRGNPEQRSDLTLRGGKPGLADFVGCVAASTSLRSARNDRLQRVMAKTIDSLLCGSINLLHRRHRLNGGSREEMERYLRTCE